MIRLDNTVDGSEIWRSPSGMLMGKTTNLNWLAGFPSTVSLSHFQITSGRKAIQLQGLRQFGGPSPS